MFSQSLDFLNALEEHLRAKNMYDGVYDAIKRIDGSVGSDERQTISQLVNTERSEVRIVLCSTTACNFGINLTGASRVVIYDTSWNPANDLQVRHLISVGRGSTMCAGRARDSRVARDVRRLSDVATATGKSAQSSRIACSPRARWKRSFGDARCRKPESHWP